MMSVGSTSSTAWGTRDPIVLTKPSGTTDGELLIAIISIATTSSTIDSVPSGWTLSETSTAVPTGVQYHAIYYKIASSEPADWSFGFTNSSTLCAGVVIRALFPNTASPFGSDSTATVTNDDTPSWANTVTPTLANSLLVMAITARQTDSGTSGYAIATDNPTWTEVFDATNTGTTFAVATAIRSATTATGNSSATLTGSSINTSDSVCTLSVFNPLPSVTTDTLVMNPSTVQSPRARISQPRWTDQEQPATPTWINQEK